MPAPTTPVRSRSRSHLPPTGRVRREVGRSLRPRRMAAAVAADVSAETSRAIAWKFPQVIPFCRVWCPHRQAGADRVGPSREPAHLLRTRNFVMMHGQVALDQELLVVRIEDCLLDVLAGKGLNRGPGLPEADRDELGTITLHTPKQPRSPDCRACADSPRCRSSAHTLHKQERPWPGPLRARFSRSSPILAHVQTVLPAGRLPPRASTPTLANGRQGMVASSQRPMRTSSHAATSDVRI